MKRVEIVYDGIEYSIGGRDIADVRAEIDRAVRAGQPYWLTAFRGEGKPQQVSLLVAPGTAISLADVGHATQDATDGGGKETETR